MVVHPLPYLSPNNFFFTSVRSARRYFKRLHDVLWMFPCPSSVACNGVSALRATASGYLGLIPSTIPPSLGGKGTESCMPHLLSLYNCVATKYQVVYDIDYHTCLCIFNILFTLTNCLCFSIFSFYCT